MSEELKDANRTESSAVQVEEETPVQTQTDEKSAAGGTSDDNIPFHEHPRFKELVEEKNRARAESEALRMEVENLKQRDRNAGNNDESPVKSALDNRIENLMNQGMDRSAAVSFANSEIGMVQDVLRQNFDPILQDQRQMKLALSLEKFKQEHSDYPKYKQAMSDKLSSLDKATQSIILSNLDEGLKYLYDISRNGNIGEIEKSSVEKGRQEAYEKKQEKSSVSPSPSSSPASLINSLHDELKNIDGNDEYAKKKKELDQKEAKLLGVMYRG